jgi:tRNA threonylcarbamoyl adenosine modification protein (Sua5/YciO/YrdC/YwlC family)
MGQYLEVHPVNPQPRFIREAAAVLNRGGVIAYPTDSCYALGTLASSKSGLERICAIRRIHPQHRFTLLLRDLSEAGTYAVFDTPTYRLLRAHTPGPYAFLLAATREAPRRLLDPKRKTIGLRVPDHPVAQAILAEVGAPLMTSSLILPGQDLALTDPQDIYARLEHELDLILDSGILSSAPTTVVDLTGKEPTVVRLGKGDPAAFLPGS